MTHKIPSTSSPPSGDTPGSAARSTRPQGWHPAGGGAAVARWRWCGRPGRWRCCQAVGPGGAGRGWGRGEGRGSRRGAGGDWRRGVTGGRGPAPPGHAVPMPGARPAGGDSAGRERAAAAAAAWRGCGAAPCSRCSSASAAPSPAPGCTPPTKVRRRGPGGELGAVFWGVRAVFWGPGALFWGVRALFWGPGLTVLCLCLSSPQ